MAIRSTPLGYDLPILALPAPRRRPACPAGAKLRCARGIVVGLPMTLVLWTGIVNLVMAAL